MLYFRSFLLPLFSLCICPVSAQTTLKVLSWNVFLTPNIAHASLQAKRAPYIAGYVLQSGADVVVLQEMFHKKASSIIEDSLKRMYPYYTPRTKGGFMKTNSGVQVFSKYPLDSSKVMQYRDCSGVDCMARKSAVMVFLDISGQKLQLVGTHMQSGGKSKKVDVRKKQLLQMTSELLEPYARTGVPQLIAGDLNIDYHHLEEYLPMREMLGTDEFRIDGEYRLTTSSESNDLCKRFFDPSAQMLDYILVRHSSTFVAMKWWQIMRPIMPAPLKNRFRDMSDHYPVMAKISW